MNPWGFEQPTFKNSCGCNFDGQSINCPAEGGFNERFWFEPFGTDANPSAENICQLGGILHIGDLVSITIPPNFFGYYVNEGDYCGCIFPSDYLEALNIIDNTPNIYQYNIYADVCSVPENSDIDINIGIDINSCDGVPGAENCENCITEVVDEENCLFNYYCEDDEEDASPINPLPIDRMIVCKCDPDFENENRDECEIRYFCVLCEDEFLIQTIPFDFSCADIALSDINYCTDLPPFGCEDCVIALTGNFNSASMKLNHNSSNVSFSNVTLTPNPFKSSFLVNIMDYPLQGEGFINIYNSNGQNVQKIPIPLDFGENQYNIELGDGMPKGMYFVAIKDVAGHQVEFKIIKN